MDLQELYVRPIQGSEELRYQELMKAHHYLGALPKIGETLWYIATYRDEWVALLGFSAAAWKCAARDPLDRLGFSPPVWPPKAGHQQQSFPHSARLALAKSGFQSDCRFAKGGSPAIGSHGSAIPWCYWRPSSIWMPTGLPALSATLNVRMAFIQASINAEIDQVH